MVGTKVGTLLRDSRDMSPTEREAGMVAVVAAA